MFTERDYPSGRTLQIILGCLEIVIQAARGKLGWGTKAAGVES